MTTVTLGWRNPWRFACPSLAPPGFWSLNDMDHGILFPVTIIAISCYLKKNILHFWLHVKILFELLVQPKVLEQRKCPIITILLEDDDDHTNDIVVVDDNDGDGDVDNDDNNPVELFQKRGKRWELIVFLPLVMRSVASWLSHPDRLMVMSFGRWSIISRSPNRVFLIGDLEHVLFFDISRCSMYGIFTYKTGQFLVEM